MPRDPTNFCPHDKSELDREDCVDGNTPLSVLHACFPLQPVTPTAPCAFDMSCFGPLATPTQERVSTQGDQQENADHLLALQTQQAQDDTHDSPKEGRRKSQRALKPPEYVPLAGSVLNLMSTDNRNAYKKAAETLLGNRMDMRELEAFASSPKARSTPDLLFYLPNREKRRETYNLTARKSTKERGVVSPSLVRHCRSAAGPPPVKNQLADLPNSTKSYNTMGVTLVLSPALKGNQHPEVCEYCGGPHDTILCSTPAKKLMPAGTKAFDFTGSKDSVSFAPQPPLIVAPVHNSPLGNPAQGPPAESEAATLTSGVPPPEVQPAPALTTEVLPGDIPPPNSVEQTASTEVIGATSSSSASTPPRTGKAKSPTQHVDGTASRPAFVSRSSGAKKPISRLEILNDAFDPEAKGPHVIWKEWHALQAAHTSYSSCP